MAATTRYTMADLTQRVAGILITNVPDLPFSSVEEINAYYGAIPPMRFSQEELKECQDDPLALINLVLRTGASYISEHSRPIDVSYWTRKK
jgi:hypothetical protein